MPGTRHVPSPQELLGHLEFHPPNQGDPKSTGEFQRTRRLLASRPATGQEVLDTLRVEGRGSPCRIRAEGASCRHDEGPQTTTNRCKEICPMERGWLRCTAEVGRCVEADRRGRLRSLTGKPALKRVQERTAGVRLNVGTGALREPTCK